MRGEPERQQIALGFSSQRQRPRRGDLPLLCVTHTLSPLKPLRIGTTRPLQPSAEWQHCSPPQGDTCQALMCWGSTCPGPSEAHGPSCPCASSQARQCHHPRGSLPPRTRLWDQG